MTTAETTEQRGPLRWVDGTMPALQERVLDIPVVGFIEYCLRGVGQVVFMNSPITGLLILAAAWIYDPWFGFAGTIAVIASTLAAHRAGLRSRRHPRGLYGFNGVLVGLGLALFLDPQWDGLVIAWIIVLSARLLGTDGGARGRVRWSVGGAPVHAGLQHHHPAVSVTGAEYRVRATRRGSQPALPVSGGPGVSPPCGPAPTRLGAPTRWRS